MGGRVLRVDNSVYRLPSALSMIANAVITAAITLWQQMVDGIRDRGSTGTIFTRLDDTLEPIMLIPQKSQYHEYDVTTHLDMAVYYADAILSDGCVFGKDFTQDYFEDMQGQRNELLLAVWLHDIEKLFRFRLSEPSSKWDKSLRPGKINLLAVCENDAGKGKKALWDYLLGDNEASEQFNDDERKLLSVARNQIYANMRYTRNAKHKTVHKSAGKLLELIARIKKWAHKKNIVEMIYYGRKIAEHCRRLVVEINGPICVDTENHYLDEHFALQHLPVDFKRLYLLMNRYTSESVSISQYRDYCVQLVKNLIEFLKDNRTTLDEWTIGLLDSSVLDKYLDL